MNKQDTRESILAEYDKSAHLYEALSIAARDLLEKILVADVAQRQTVTHRPKDRVSLTKKLERPGKDYKKLADITDVAGVRVVTYFEEDIDKVAAAIEAEFEIDKANSVDKRTYKDPDRFGYKSLHYVASFSAARCVFPEYKPFKGMKFEIQLRSILQHAWAEVEHKLGGYKSPASVPRHVRRRFARIAGLLELADEEFPAIRTALQTYAEDTQELIGKHPDKVGVDTVSLKSLLMLPTSQTRRLADAIGVAFHRPVAEDQLDSARLDDSVFAASLLDLRTIADIEQVVAAEHETTLHLLHDQSGGAMALPSIPTLLGVSYPLLIQLSRSGKLQEYIDHIAPGGGADGFAEYFKGSVERATAERDKQKRTA